ncbi:helix-turn-helix domain-containing protein [Pseudoruegeria sp. SHC-113]|uniref:helix-turn-helix domain-containing protein n=1 Tax=Pseudoruegeria sp. SHC-113 TaxID=2855439 RepID=UPI0021BB7EB3|nr:helix-turn-helix domain-containing protein [Pseudoruegeria sp. SHC-113]MCT8158685.1 helix-turn-helix domain-containing protein [Pseudoruegeria sp. SHC-113]
MLQMHNEQAALHGVPSDERDLYQPGRAFGRFGMRHFQPNRMERPHWHGHVEFNLISGSTMTYDYDGRAVLVPQDQVVMFWAGIPHRLTDFGAPDLADVRLTNLYVPADTFLFMPHISPMQVAMLAGEIRILPLSALPKGKFLQWLEDCRSGSEERREILLQELNATLRRAQAADAASGDLRPGEGGEPRGTAADQTAKLAEMVRYILENLHAPLTVAQVAETVGLHPNYASSLFAKRLRMPMKRFFTRMRLIRARAILIEGRDPISVVAEMSGFSSMTQFYEHFRAAYGQTPKEMRAQYARGWG